MTDEMHKGVGFAVLLAIVFGVGVLAGSLNACFTISSALRLSGHGDLQSIVKEVALCH